MEIFTNITDYVKSRFTNPILCTLLGVWLIRNWLLVYSLFTFDKNFGWKEKVDFINNYFYSKDLGHEIWTNVWISFVILLATFLILAAARLLTNSYERYLLPLIYKLTDKHSIVLKADFDSLLTKYNKLKNDKDELNKEITEHDEKIKSMQKRISEEVEKSLKYEELKEENDNLRPQNVELGSQIIELNKTIKEKDEMIKDKDFRIEELLKTINDKNSSEKVYTKRIGTLDDETPSLFERSLYNKAKTFEKSDKANKLNKLDRESVKVITDNGVLLDFINVMKKLQVSDRNERFYDADELNYFIDLGFIISEFNSINGEYKGRYLKISNSASIFYDYLLNSKTTIEKL